MACGAAGRAFAVPGRAAPTQKGGRGAGGFVRVLVPGGRRVRPRPASGVCGGDIRSGFGWANVPLTHTNAEKEASTEHGAPEFAQRSPSVIAAARRASARFRRIRSASGLVAKVAAMSMSSSSPTRVRLIRSASCAVITRASTARASTRSGCPHGTRGADEPGSEARAGRHVRTRCAADSPPPCRRASTAARTGRWLPGQSF